MKLGVIFELTLATLVDDFTIFTLYSLFLDPSLLTFDGRCAGVSNCVGTLALLFYFYLGPKRAIVKLITALKSKC